VGSIGISIERVVINTYTAMRLRGIASESTGVEENLSLRAEVFYVVVCGWAGVVESYIDRPNLGVSRR
jgi:hypothetical protein